MVPYTLGKESYPYKSIGCNLVWFRPLVPTLKTLENTSRVFYCLSLMQMLKASA